MNRPLPAGSEVFGKLKENEFYYVGKSLFMKELLEYRSEVSLFMRPRRFGKTLSLSRSVLGNSEYGGKGGRIFAAIIR